MNRIQFNASLSDNTQQQKHRFLCFLLLLVICASVFIQSNPVLAAENSDEIAYSRGRVIRLIEVLEENTDSSGGTYTSNAQWVEVAVIKGHRKGETHEAQYELNYSLTESYQSDRLKVGDEVLLYFDEDEEGTLYTVYVMEIARDKHLLWVAGAFMVLLVLIGGLTGLKAIVSLALTGLAVIYLLLPAILKGWDPVFISVVICIAIIIVTLIIISGWSRKTLAAIIGTSGGVLFAGIIALIIGTAAKMTGFGDDESQMLMYIPQEIKLDFRGLLFAGILLGTMGATMDTGMSIASAMHELRVNNPKIKTGALIRSGMNIGRDTMATMSNTLILAYTGGSLHLMLLMMAFKTPFTQVVNWDIIASEILRAMAGSIGIILTVPITALAAGFIHDYKKRQDIPHRTDHGMY